MSKHFILNQYRETWVEVEDYINDPKMLRNVNLSYFEVNADNGNDTGIRLLTKG